MTIFLLSKEIKMCLKWDEIEKFKIVGKGEVIHEQMCEGARESTREGMWLNSE